MASSAGTPWDELQEAVRVAWRDEMRAGLRAAAEHLKGGGR